MKTVVSFNGTIASTGTTQALDSNAPQQLPSQPKAIMKGTPPPITITALSANTATIYISSSIGTASGHGYPLQAGKSVTFRTQTTSGIYVNGTSGDKYGVASGTVVLHKAGSSNAIPAAIAFWPLTDGVGAGTFLDHIGSANMPWYSAPSYSTVTGMGASPVPFLNHTGGQAAVESALNFNGTQPMSVALWVYTPAAGTQVILTDLDVANGYTGWEVDLTSISGQPVAEFIVVCQSGNGQITVNSTTTFALNVAVFLVVTYTGSQKAAGVKFYINGSASANTVITDTITGGGATSTIGVRTGDRTDGSGAFNDVAYIRVWNVVLTQGQISALYALGPQ